ncbi:MAG TPA: non-heme iron oxygenase ferredoxin subunit [Nitrososphaeraceae archaeon]|nr:non-heme iron oxygenase ferredoxin subunit [Nitrososphaeraceae archaeon]
MSQNEFTEVAKVSEISDGKMKHVEVDGKEVLIANVGGKFYAISDRCGHMNALLSMGNLTGNTVTCPFHGAKFDVTTGRKLSEPILTPSQEMEPLPQTWQKFFENVGQLMSRIKTYNQAVYETKIDEDSIKIKI